ncbi:hypothetical protein K7432_012759 [Basidiobolus ranarum]|uniref:BZIP domain-containing protein n=1 Tax=Basidiobolus ranarum TaxID=34480 RepID=A0ABR2WKB4_9FUNG
MDLHCHFNGINSDQVSIFSSEQSKNDLYHWDSTDLCFNGLPQLNMDGFPILNPADCVQMNSALPDSSALLYQYFTDSTSTLSPESPPGLTHSPPYSPQTSTIPMSLLTLPTSVFPSSCGQKNNHASYAPILPNGIPQTDIASATQVSTTKRKFNPDREANRVALLTAAASDPKLAAKLENEEDKRRRNTAASARFRIKKKLREEALEKTTKEMSDKANSLEKKVKELEMEVKWLQTLLIDKDPNFVNVVPPFKKQCK